MSLTVRHLNGDSTFLLLFSPYPHPSSSDLSPASNVYSVLVDPWITGSSIVSAKWFAVTNRVEPSAVSHLSELDEPDVVICSQNKPDHTHKETLLQLKPEGKTVIAAEPGAAKAIKSWNHFDPNRVFSLSRYDPRAKFGNSLRLYIAPLAPEGVPGELVISFIPAKNYVTGLHNAIGITYQAPTRTKALAPVTTIDLPKPKYFHLPLSPASTLGTSPPQLSPTYPYHQAHVVDSQETVVPVKSTNTSSHRPQISRASNTGSSELLALPYQPLIRPSMEELQSRQLRANLNHLPEIRLSSDTRNFSPTPNLPTPPDSPYSVIRTSATSPLERASFTPKSSISSLSNAASTQTREHSRTLSTSNKPPTIYPAKPKAISIVYTPHGITTSDLKPYIQNHLIKLPGALPLTLLLHSFDHAQNPWYLGGNVMAGAIGGMAIARSLMARCWISAHDEAKDDRGMAVKLLKTERMTADEIRRELASDEDGKGHGWTCDVRSLASGQEMFLPSDQRDLLVGFTCGDVKQGLTVEDSTLLNQKVVVPAAG